MVAPSVTDAGPRHAASMRVGFVLVSTYSWMCITIGVALARFVLGLIVHKIEFGADNTTIFVGTVLYIGTIVCWQSAIDAGLGNDERTKNANDVTSVFKAIYAAVVLGIISTAFAKLSSVYLMERVTPQSRKVKTVLYGMIAVWAVSSVFAVFIQCGLPQRAAKSPQCHAGSLVITTIMLNIVTDLILAAWILPTILSVSLDREKCKTAAILFGARAIVPLVAGAQMWAVATAASSDKLIHDVVNVVVLTQAVTSLSLIASSIPRIKRFLGVGGSGIVYPVVSANELLHGYRSSSQQGSRYSEPKLVPSRSGGLTVTVSSNGSKGKPKANTHLEWYGLATVGTKEEDHTSTSSLVGRDEYNSVMMQREVEVKVSVEKESIRKIR